MNNKTILLNSAFIWCEEFYRSRAALSISAFTLGGQHPSKYFDAIVFNIMNRRPLYIVFSCCRTTWRILRGRYPPWPSASVENENILLDLHNSSHPTQPDSIISNWRLDTTWISWGTNSNHIKDNRYFLTLVSKTATQNLLDLNFNSSLPWIRSFQQSENEHLSLNSFHNW